MFGFFYFKIIVMKLYVILFIGLYPFFISAQCITGNVHIFNEEKLHEFKQNFPECDTISGNLIIGPEVAGGQTRLVDIKGLEKIKVIKGNLEINNNQWLEDITPLQKMCIRDSVYSMAFLSYLI